MAYRDNPPTACDRCRRAEMTTWEKIRDRFGGRSRTFAELLDASGIAFAFMLTGGRGVSWEVRHREAYISKGDPIEYERMLRHISLSEVV